MRKREGKSDDINGTLNPTELIIRGFLRLEIEITQKEDESRGL